MVCDCQLPMACGFYPALPLQRCSGGTAPLVPLLRKLPKPATKTHPSLNSAAELCPTLSYAWIWTSTQTGMHLVYSITYSVV